MVLQHLRTAAPPLYFERVHAPVAAVRLHPQLPCVRWQACALRVEPRALWRV